jgi:DNA-binding Lrp family transcriptional regulator
LMARVTALDVLEAIVAGLQDVDGGFEPVDMVIVRVLQRSFALCESVTLRELTSVANLPVQAVSASVRRMAKHGLLTATAAFSSRAKADKAAAATGTVLEKAVKSRYDSTTIRIDPRELHDRVKCKLLLMLKAVQTQEGNCRCSKSSCAYVTTTTEAMLDAMMDKNARQTSLGSNQYVCPRCHEGLLEPVKCDCTVAELNAALGPLRASVDRLRQALEAMPPPLVPAAAASSSSSSSSSSSAAEINDLAAELEREMEQEAAAAEAALEARIRAEEERQRQRMSELEASAAVAAGASAEQWLQVAGQMVDFGRLSEEEQQAQLAAMSEEELNAYQAFMS